MDDQKLVDSLNEIISDLDEIKKEFGMPRVRANHFIGAARSRSFMLKNGKYGGPEVSQTQFAHEGWDHPDRLAFKLNKIADKYDSLPNGMVRARAIKILNGGVRSFDVTNEEEIDEKLSIPPNSITLNAIEEWRKEMELFR